MRKYRKYIIIAILLIIFSISVCFIPIDATRFVSIVEKQAEQEYGVKVHIEKLIFRFGPSLKIKAPVMHVMYEDGQKFAQMDNVKFYVPWSTLYSDNIVIKRISADRFILKINSCDKYLNRTLAKITERDYELYPNIKLNNYNIAYTDTDSNKIYQLKGNNVELTKIANYKSLKFDSDGTFFINNIPHISYDIEITPNFEYSFSNDDLIKNIKVFADSVESLDFHSDIIADLKLYKDKNNELQISGLTNIDNISVLDPGKKNPKSFIYLTFLGNKTGVLSNIYAAPDKKIYVDGVINNSKKAEVDLKVKTDKIRITDVYNKIKLFADFSKFKGITEIDGNLIADFTIKGDLNKLKSAGYLKISDASLKANGINIYDIIADVDFSNNIITIANAVGFVNRAPIMLKGKISKNINLQLLMNKVELKHLLPEKYGIDSGIVSLDASLTGTTDNLKHKEKVYIENFKAKNNKYSFAFDNLNINTNKDNTAYISNLTIKPQLTELIKLPLLKICIEDDKIKIPETNIYMPNSKLQAKGEVINYNTKDYVFTVSTNGYINSKDLSGITRISSIYPLKINVNGNKSVQNIESQIQLLKASIIDEPALINFNAVKENNILKIEDFSLLPFNATFSNNLKSNIKGNKKLIITGNIEELKNPILKNIRIYIPQQLNLNIQNTIAQLKGDIFINGQIKQPDIVGQLNIISLINQFLQLSVNNASLDFNKDTVVLNAPMIKIGDSNLGINSSVSTDFSKEILIKNINIKSKYINMDTILMYKDIPELSSYPIKIKDGKLYAERASATVYDGNLYFSAFNSDFNLNNQQLFVYNIMTDLYNGKMSGNIKYNLKDDSYAANIQSRGISAAPIFDIVTSKKDSLSGAMDFDAELSGNLLSKQSLNGNVKFIVHNGHMGTLGKLEHLLYAQNIIADSMLRTSLSAVTKAITLRDTGLFKYLRGDISIKDGIANIKSLQSQGPLMALFIKGQYNPMIDYAKLVVLGRISDELIDCLGVFGEFSVNKLMIMLTGEDNKLSIPAEDIEKLPQLPMKNTKEFRTVINGILEKPSSVIQFNWISYSQKSYRQKEIPLSSEKIPDFIENLPY